MKKCENCNQEFYLNEELVKKYGGIMACEKCIDELHKGQPCQHNCTEKGYIPLYDSSGEHCKKCIPGWQKDLKDLWMRESGKYLINIEFFISKILADAINKERKCPKSWGRNCPHQLLK